jgi:hypothetical protein
MKFQNKFKSWVVKENLFHTLNITYWRINGRRKMGLIEVRK